MLHHPASETTARPGPEEWFTGQVWAETMTADDEALANVVRVSFEPGARTAWHVHSKGQILIVTSGHGFVQKRGEARRTMAVGDVVVIAPGEDHWHGAAPDCLMQHLAIHHANDVQWGEKVSEAEYRG